MKPVSRQFIHTAFLLIGLIAVTGCSNTRHLADNESLYTGNKVRIVDETITAGERSALEDELSAAVRPKPNRRFLGVRFKLTLYNLAGVPKKEKGFRNWLRNKIGEPPVLGSSVNIPQNNKILQNYLQNRGFFYAEVLGDKITEGKKTKAEFDVKAGNRYKLRNLIYQQSDTSELSAHILETREKSLLKTGDPYNLDLIIAERERVDNILKNQGYYYFSPEFLLAQADTSAGENEVDIRMRLKYDIMPRNAYRQYRINKVSVYPNYRFNTGTGQRRRGNRNRQTTAGDTVEYRNFTMVDRQHTFKPVVFSQAMQFASGDIYSQREQNLALNRLVSMGVFKFVKNEFVAVRDTSSGGSNSGLSNLSYNILLQRGLLINKQALLNVNYYLTPYPKKSFNIEAGGFTLNDSRAGSRLSFSWRNRNFFRGAELFNIKLTGGFEAQYGGIVRRPNTYNIGVESNLAIPRFLVPFVRIKPSSVYPPQTIITAGYNYYLRSGLYRIHTLNTGFGYNWRENAQKEHKFFPFNITYVRTDTLDKNAEMDVNLSNLIFNGIIFGPTYEYTYNTQTENSRNQNDFYFQGIADLSGNLVGIAQGASADDPKRFLGARYAQYLKFQTDFRFYRRLNSKQTIASRLLLGYGYSYGNSTQLPNIKQFFSGGSSSLRGFNSRLVGPGTYNENYLTGKNTYIEMLGDMKLEASVELRGKLYSILEGAIFADAGNIWLQRANPSFPGGAFSKNFYKELAVDAGLGLRFDLTILLLRFDFGIPLRKPWLPEGQRWVFNDIRFGDPVWRKENIIFSLAIGYPF